jgi:hypothetical protein
VVCPERATRLRELWNILCGFPYNRARFATPQNRKAMRKSQQGQDLTICSWEPFDFLAPHLPGPLILIAHNITSEALPRIFPRNPIAWLLAIQARLWEQKIFRLPHLTAIVTLSKKDRSYVASLPDVAPVILTVPGMPPVIMLKRDAQVANELVLSGTYDWRPKRRDVIKFARSYASSKNSFPVLCDRLPKRAADILTVQPIPPETEAAETIRFGIVSDQFESGHKLKTLAYIAQNQIVLSMSDVNSDLAEIPDHYFFVRRIRSVAEIGRHLASINRMEPTLLRARFVKFQLACAERFNWESVANKLSQAAEKDAHKTMVQSPLYGPISERNDVPASAHRHAKDGPSNATKRRLTAP